MVSCALSRGNSGTRLPDATHPSQAEHFFLWTAELNIRLVNVSLNFVPSKKPLGALTGEASRSHLFRDLFRLSRAKPYGRHSSPPSRLQHLEFFCFSSGQIPGIYLSSSFQNFRLETFGALFRKFLSSLEFCPRIGARHFGTVGALSWTARLAPSGNNGRSQPGLGWKFSGLSSGNSCPHWIFLSLLVPHGRCS